MRGHLGIVQFFISVQNCELTMPGQNGRILLHMHCCWVGASAYSQVFYWWAGLQSIMFRCYESHSTSLGCREGTQTLWSSLLLRRILTQSLVLQWYFSPPCRMEWALTSGYVFHWGAEVSSRHHRTAQCDSPSNGYYWTPFRDHSVSSVVLIN